MARRIISSKLRANIFRRDGYCCLRCGLRQSDVELNINHIIPVSQGGGDEPENLSTLCRMCHREWEIVEPFDICLKKSTYEDFMRCPPLRYFFHLCRYESFSRQSIDEAKAGMLKQIGAGQMTEHDRQLNRHPSRLAQSRQKLGSGISSWLMVEDSVYNLVVDMRRQGESYKKIAQHLADLDERDDLGRPFVAASVKKILGRYVNNSLGTSTPSQKEK